MNERNILLIIALNVSMEGMGYIRVYHHLALGKTTYRFILDYLFAGSALSLVRQTTYIEDLEIRVDILSQK